MAATYPKPDGERTRNRGPAFTWTFLPASGRKGRPPRMPDGDWRPETRRTWSRWWSSPQAAAWQPDGRTLHSAVRLEEMANRIIAGDASGNLAAIEAELRQHMDRHGWSPKALLQLRWRITPDEDANVIGGRSKAPAVDRAEAAPPPPGAAKRLKLVDL